MYNEKIENLINHALADGELTEKEKQILFKKAEAEGIDLDEFEMVLESKLFAHKQGNQKVSDASAVAPKSDKLGDVKKCPACGAIIESFSTKCPDCGHEIRNINASQNIIKFFERLDELESNRTEQAFTSEKVSGKLGCSTMVMWYLFFWILIPYKLIIYAINKSKPPKWSTTDSRKEEMIMNFPVPNSREDITEFLTLSISRIQSMGFIKKISEEGKYINKWNGIWIKKCKQIYMKAKISMSDDQKNLRLIEGLLKDAKII